MSNSKAELRQALHGMQEGICAICGEVIVKDPPKLVTRGPRKGLPLKNQDLLHGYWLMKIDHSGSYDESNLVLVHAICGRDKGTYTTAEKEDFYKTLFKKS